MPAVICAVRHPITYCMEGTSKQSAYRWTLGCVFVCAVSVLRSGGCAEDQAHSVNISTGNTYPPLESLKPVAQSLPIPPERPGISEIPPGFPYRTERMFVNFVTASSPEMYRFLHPPPRPLREKAPHDQFTLILTGAAVESIPDAVCRSAYLDMD